MRYALSMLLAACYAPTVETGVPCASNFDCPANQMCNRTVAPPTCGTPAVTGDAAMPDAGGDASVVPLGPWGTPTLVMTPVTLEDDPTLTADLRELYFNRDQTTIWRIRRTAVGAPWSLPEEVPELAPATTPEIAADGLTMYLASARSGTAGMNDIWVATRPTREAAWSAPVRVAELSTAGEESNATPSTDHLALLLVRRVGPAGVDIFAATRSSLVASWSTPTAIAALNTTLADGDAMLTADGLAVYFYSTRAGMGDLYTATRATTNAAFGTPQPITELNTPQFVEQDPWISPDGRHLIFASDRSGQMAIYESQR